MPRSAILGSWMLSKSMKIAVTKDIQNDRDCERFWVAPEKEKEKKKSLIFFFLLCWLNDYFVDCCLTWSVNHILVQSFWHNSLLVTESQIKSPECRVALTADGQNPQDLQVKQGKKNEDEENIQHHGERKIFPQLAKEFSLSKLYAFWLFLKSNIFFVESAFCWETLMNGLIYWWWSQKWNHTRWSDKC